MNCKNLRFLKLPREAIISVLSRVPCLVYLLLSITCIVSERDIICPTWMYRSISGSSHCVCGIDLHKAVLCNSSSQQVQVCRSFMITYDPTHNETIAGYSFYAFTKLTNKGLQSYYSVPSNASQINARMCDPLNRSGLFCGECKEGHSPLVYSYKFNCANCSGAGVVWMSLTFVAFAFIPVTLLLICSVV